MSLNPTKSRVVAFSDFAACYILESHRTKHLLKRLSVIKANVLVLHKRIVKDVYVIAGMLMAKNFSVVFVHGMYILMIT